MLQNLFSSPSSLFFNSFALCLFNQLVFWQFLAVNEVNSPQVHTGVFHINNGRVQHFTKIFILSVYPNYIYYFTI